MATSWSLTPAEAELVSSLAEDDIPTKLRCANCSKLAVNAFKLPCCEQLIDDACHLTLPSTCPVCTHTPLSPNDCNPNKAMRNTIKIFIKTKLKNRETSLAKESKDSAPPTPVDAKPDLLVAAVDAGTSTAEPAKEDVSIGNSDGGSAEQTAQPADGESRQNGSADTEETSQLAVKDELAAQEHPNQVPDTTEEAQVAVKDAGEAKAPESGNPQNATNLANAPGFDAMSGSYPNMNYGGDYSQMQMMMAMQNGMMNSNFSLPMMGMSGTGMDPMMQNMYMNGGFGSQGMGMNGMNMMGGGYGNGSSGSNNWNGQQSWDIGQDNFNHQGASGNGDYGSYNSGFQTGYNQQGNFGHHNQYSSYYGRGRGRGRGRGFYGGYGRGGHNSRGSFGNNQGSIYASQQCANGPVDQMSHSQDHSAIKSNQPIGRGNVDEFGRQMRSQPGSDERHESGDGSGATPEGPNANSSGIPGADTDPTVASLPRENASTEPQPVEGAPDPAAGAGAGAATASGDRSSHQTGEAEAIPVVDVLEHPTGGPSRSFDSTSGNGGSSMLPPTNPVPDVPLNAPSGPKAMRQGHPNTRFPHLRGRGLHMTDERVLSPTSNGSGLPSPGAEHLGGPTSKSSNSPDIANRRGADMQRERGRGRSRDKDMRSQDKGQLRSRSRSSRTRSRDRRDRHRRSRHRGESASDSGHGSDPNEDQNRRSRHHRKHSAYDDAEESKSVRPRDHKFEGRSRSASPEESRRSSHRSRRDRDSEKRRDREKDKDRDGDREHRRRTSHRERDYDNEHDRDRERRGRDKDKDRSSKDRPRDRHKDRERERDHRRRGSKMSTGAPPTPVEAPEGGFNPPTRPPAPPNRPFEIKGASSKPNDGPLPIRRSSQASAKLTTTGQANADPYAAEREARTRERLLAEAQKLAGLSSVGGLKRGRDDGDDGRRNRRKGRRGDVVAADDMGERLRRGEAERDGRRPH